jgi:hypothetical protein
MAVSTTTSLEIAGELITACVKPKIPYSNACLQVRGRGIDFKVFADDEQLAEIGFAIQQHLERTRSHETPDHQMILNHEINQSIEEETYEPNRAASA